MSLLDEFTKGFSSAIDDIRSKVVEQGWTGQQQNYGGSGGWADTKPPEVEATPIEAPEIGIDNIEAMDASTEPDIEAPPIEPADTGDIMEMFTPPPEAEQEQEQGQEQEGMDI